MGSSRYAPADAKGGIWVFLEQRDGALLDVSRELLGKARLLADEAKQELTGLLLGYDVENAAVEAVRCGADKVWMADQHVLHQYRTDAYVLVAEQAILEGKPGILILGATADGRDLAGRLAVRLRTGLTADCTEMTVQDTPEGTLLLGEVTGFGGGIAAVIACKAHRPQMATVRPGVFPLPKPRTRSALGRIKSFQAEIPPDAVRTEVVERKFGGESGLTRARFLVVGGRGVNGDFKVLEELARKIGAEIGATRVAVDEGWIGRDRMVGQTGYSTRPRVAIACGVSGALQFMVGVQAADVIVAINNDPEAPIFEQVDYAVNGDLHQLVPALVKALK